MVKGMCSICRETIGSEHVYDSKTCGCGNSWLDGGQENWLTFVSSSFIDDVANVGGE